MKKPSKTDQLLAKIEALEKQLAELKEQVAKIPAAMEVHNHYHAAPNPAPMLPSPSPQPWYDNPTPYPISPTPVNPFSPTWATCHAAA